MEQIKAQQQFELFGKKIFEKVIIKPPFKIVAEMQHQACFYYVIKGWATTATPTQKIHTKTNEGLLLQCGTYVNEYIASSSTDELCEAIGIHFHPDVIKMIYDKELPNFLVGLGKVEPLKYEEYRNNSLLVSYIESLQFYFDNPAMVSEELIKLKLKELILLLVKTNNVEAISKLFGRLFTPYEYSFKETIETNIFNNYSIEEIASLANMSLSSFKREFQKHYNTSPAKYIRKRKLEKASKLLTATSLRITEIALDCGFADLAHFSKCFQKEYGHSPTDYRLKLINNSK